MNKLLIQLRMMAVALVLLSIPYTVMATAETGRPSRLIQRNEPGDLATERASAVDWATPECRNAVRLAVSHARSIDEISKNAWDACPNHPEAFY